jgi:hypothetical protein
MTGSGAAVKGGRAGSGGGGGAGGGGEGYVPSKLSRKILLTAREQQLEAAADPEMSGTVAMAKKSRGPRFAAGGGAAAGAAAAAAFFSSKGRKGGDEDDDDFDDDEEEEEEEEAVSFEEPSGVRFVASGDGEE